MQILAFLARRGKGGADSLKGKTRDAAESEFEVMSCGGGAV